MVNFELHWTEWTNVDVGTAPPNHLWDGSQHVEKKKAGNDLKMLVEEYKRKHWMTVNTLAFVWERRVMKEMGPNLKCDISAHVQEGRKRDRSAHLANK